jgi:hypothetical protein
LIRYQPARAGLRGSALIGALNVLNVPIHSEKRFDTFLLTQAEENSLDLLTPAVLFLAHMEGNVLNS